MGFLVELIREYGFGIVFLNVFVEQLGAPIPAYPVLVVTGALEGADWVRLLWLVAVAVSAALIADLFWYQAGKAYGHRVLGRICRISLSPDACIPDRDRLWPLGRKVAAGGQVRAGLRLHRQRAGRRDGHAAAQLRAV